MPVRQIASIILYASISIVCGQATDTVGVSSDTTQIRIAEPFAIDTLDTKEEAVIGADRTQIDTLASIADTLTWRERHSPQKATILSAVVPGAGQIYNRKYWKAPIVWAGIGISYSFIRENHKEYKRYRTAYLALVDEDPATVDEFNGQYDPGEVRRVMEVYQRWRDISYIALAGVYVLNIIDASVDAHFVRFDVSPDLSLNIGPSLHAAALGATGVNLQFSLR